jgi:hypothetical protein
MPVPDFSPGEVLTAAAMDSIGLWLVKTQAITAGTSSVSVTSAFSTDYDSYRIVVSNGTLAGLAFISGQMTGSTGNNYYGALTGTAIGTNTFAGVSNNNTPAWGVLGIGNTTFLSLAFDVHDPFLARPTRVGPSNYASTTDAGVYNGLHNVATSYTGITLATASTFQSGTVRVYGYRK